MPEDLFQVYWLPGSRNALRELARRAKEVDLLDALKQAIAELNERLQREPLEVGELYRTRGAVVEQAATHQLVVINFAVDTERKVVAVRRCRAMTSSGL